LGGNDVVKLVFTLFIGDRSGFSRSQDVRGELCSASAHQFRPRTARTPVWRKIWRS
jgi:hypothetical protein